MSPVVMTHILAKPLTTPWLIWHQSGTTRSIWHHPRDPEMRRNRRLTCGFSWWSLGDSNP